MHPVPRQETSRCDAENGCNCLLTLQSQGFAIVPFARLSTYETTNLAPALDALTVRPEDSMGTGSLSVFVPASQAVLQKQASRGHGAHVVDLFVPMSVTPLPADLLCRHAYHSYPSPQQFFDSYVAVEACHTRPPDDSPGWGPWIAQHPFSRVFNTGNTDVGLTGHLCLYCRSGTMKSWASSRLDSRKKYAQRQRERERESTCIHIHAYRHQSMA